MIGPIKRGEAAHFTHLVEELGLADNVTFTGFMDHQSALDVLPRLDVAVAFHEGDAPIFNVAVPTKILEYLAHGCCIVASDQVMYRNILTDKHDAILTPQTPKGLATGMRKALQDKECNFRLRANARITAENYTTEKQVESLEKIYGALVSEGTVNWDQMILHDDVPAMVKHASP
jgi:glycosyltransferase involved in cell wall biosynthesis